MKTRETYMLCCNCGYFIKKNKMFIKKYQNTAICLCRRCALELVKEIVDETEEKLLKELESEVETK